MRKILVLILLMIVLVACKQQVVECKSPYFEYKTGDCCLDKDNNKICDSDEKQEETKEPVKDDSVKAETTEKQEEIKGPIVQELYNNALDLLQAYEFQFTTDIVSVYEDKMKILYPRVVRLQEKVDNKNAYITEVYIDKTNRKATGYCDVSQEKEIHKVTEYKYSVCAPLANITFGLNYDRYNIKTPLEWLKQFQHTTPSKVFDATQTIKIGKHWKTITPVLFFSKEDQPDTIFRIDTHYKIPVRVEIYDNEIMASKYDYDNVQVATSAKAKKEIKDKITLNFTYW